MRFLQQSHSRDRKQEGCCQGVEEGMMEGSLFNGSRVPI